MDSSRTASFTLPRLRRAAGAPAGTPGRPGGPGDGAAGAAAGGRPSPAATARRPAARTVARRAMALVLVLAAVAAGGWWWLRDSSFVAIRDVQITGVSGAHSSAVRSALANAARSMTTLHVQPEELRAAVAGYPVVKSVTAVGDFPHGLRIAVTERTAVAGLRVGDRIIPVAGDGTLLRGTDHEGLPAVSVKTPPGGATLTDPLARAEVRLLAAAPAALRARVTKVFTGSRGIAMQLSRGPVIAFGGADRATAKWMALAAVLASPAAAGGSLIDLGVPERPAVAGLEPEPDPTGSTADGSATATTGDASGAATTTTPATDAAGVVTTQPTPVTTTSQAPTTTVTPALTDPTTP